MTETGDLRFRQLLHHAATEELIAELRARGALEALGPAKAAAIPAGPAFELAQQYARNRAGLSALGFTDADSIPPYDLIARHFDPELAQWLNSRRAIGHHDELVLSPSLQQSGLFGSNGLWARVTRLFTADKVRLGYPDMWKEMYADGIADHSGGTRWLAAIALGDMLDPRDLSQPANQHGEPGLVYTNADAAAQRGRLQQESAALAARSRILAPIAIGQLLVLHAVRHQAGQPGPDSTGTTTRFVQYPEHTFRDLPGLHFLPAAYVDNGSLVLGGAADDIAWTTVGARRAILLPLEDKQESPADTGTLACLGPARQSTIY